MATLTLEQRVLAGIRFEDIATGATIATPLHLRAVPGNPPVDIRANRRSIHVVYGAEGFADYVASFAQAPELPPVGDVTVELEVRDPGGVYLPRQFSLDLPRVADPEQADSVFEAVGVHLLRSPQALRSRNWAMIRIRLNAGATPEPVPAALLRVVHDPAGEREILGWGMSVCADPEAHSIEKRARQGARWVHFGQRHVGEASVPVVGLSGQVWAVGEGEDVLLTDIPAALEVVPMTIPGAGRLPNPDDFFAAATAPGNRRPITLSVGGNLNAEPFSVTL